MIKHTCNELVNETCKCLKWPDLSQVLQKSHVLKVRKRIPPEKAGYAARQRNEDEASQAVPRKVHCKCAPSASPTSNMLCIPSTYTIFQLYCNSLWFLQSKIRFLSPIPTIRLQWSRGKWTLVSSPTFLCSNFSIISESNSISFYQTLIHSFESYLLFLKTKNTTMTTLATHIFECLRRASQDFKYLLAILSLPLRCH